MRHGGAPAAQLLVSCAVGVACGAAATCFAALLQAATQLRCQQAWLTWCLPLAGLLLGTVWTACSKPLQGGMGPIIDRLDDGGSPLPRRHGPLVLGGTVLTHLFGGSVGREGVAVQLGATLAEALQFGFRLPAAWRRGTLAAGVAGGFAAVFGTPLAAACFAMEWVRRGTLNVAAPLPLVVAALVGDATAQHLGVRHTVWPQVAAPRLDAPGTLRWLLFAAAIAAVGLLFLELTQALRRLAERSVPQLPLRLLLGGALFVALWQLSGGTQTYLGLGIPGIVDAFGNAALPAQAWAYKLVLTSLCLAAGFWGGEVTPLFFIGASFGNVVAGLLGLPLQAAAGLGMVGLFACVAHTPLALTLMAMELFGPAIGPAALLVCLSATACMGRRGLYAAQR